MSPSCYNWRGEWLSLKDLAQVMGKSYGNLKVMLNQGYLNDIHGIRIHRIASRVWFQVDRDTYDSLVSGK